MSCPEDEQLKNFLDGRLAEEVCSKLETHLQSCLTCQSRLPEMTEMKSSVLTSFDYAGDSQFEFLDEPECFELQEFAKALPHRSHSPEPTTTIVVDPSDINTGIPESIGRYQVIRHLGAGSFGSVYLARDAQLDRHVAIKVAHATRVLTDADAERYQREAKLLARMEHSNIVPVYDSGLTEDGLVFIVFRFIRGSNLAEMMEPERFPLEKSVELTCTIANALHYMHSHGIVHRDIKPANVLIDQTGVPFLTDFGLAVRSDDLMLGREVVGTLAYMSPEQLSGDSHLVGPRSDIFSLGVLLFELLTGQRPFPGRKLERTISWMHEAPSPCDFEKNLPVAIGRVCQKALQNRSADRYSSAKEFERELRAACSDVNQKSEKAVSTPVYRGLRAFHRDDQDFFCELLPGLRSRQGNPESVQFWIDRIRKIQGEAQPRIGVIYGNTGCGKSSLVHAAIIPKLADDVTVISIQASVTRTEYDLSKSLKSVFKSSETVDSLPEICRQIRMRKPPFANQRILIVIDQFEQWLHGRKIDLSVELIQALRQCDGESIQCLLIVRDDFWVELSKFMRTVEEPMREGDNMMAVEPFPVEHAERVLLKIGQAVKTDSLDEQSQLSFVKRGVDLIQTEGCVPPVRLALFVEITKDLPWESETIRHLEDLTVLAQTYIKQRFDPELCPRRFRTHTTAMKSVLAALLPERGADLKGQGRSLSELKSLCGYENSPERFKQMIDLMDRDLRIISPVQVNETDATEDLSYQLTHDYLVPAIRSWIDEEELRTFRGRAKLKLRERVSLWGLKSESRQLPGVMEVLQILLGTQISQWTSEQKRLMTAALKFHVSKGIAVFVLLLVFTGFLFSRARGNADRSLVQQLSQAGYESVPQLLKKVDARQPDIIPIIQELLQDESIDIDQKTRLQLAALEFDKSVAEDLKEKLLNSGVDEFQVIAHELLEHSIALEEFKNIVADEESSLDAKLRASAIIMASLPEDDVDKPLVEAVVTGVLSQTRDTVPKWSRWIFPYRDRLSKQFKKNFLSQSDSQFLAHSALVLSIFFQDQPSEYVELILNSNDQQLETLCDEANSFSDEKLRKVIGELNSKVSNLTNSNLSDHQISQKVNAISALGHFGFMKTVASHLHRSADPSIRYFLVQKLPKSRCHPHLLIQYLRETQDEEVIAAMFLILGTYDQAIFNESMQFEIRELALEYYQNHPGAEVHSAAEWLLNKLGESSTLPASLDRPHDHEWFVNHSGYTMIIPPDEFLRIQDKFPAKDDELYVDWDFAISSTEVTVQQYLLFDKNHRFSSQLQSSRDCPVSHVNFETAAQYCNWLSIQEGLAEEDVCYEEKDGRVRVKSNFLQCKGYRLPMSIEWEIAAQASTESLYPFGKNTKLINAFAWHIENSQSRLHPTGELLPNQLGLFDVCGNVGEWCHNQESLKSASGKWHSNSSVPACGGTYRSVSTSFSPYGSMQSKEHPVMGRDGKLAYVGFRVAKTIRPPSQPPH